MKIARIEIIDAKLEPEKVGGWHPTFVVVENEDGARGVGEMGPFYSPGIAAAIRHLELQAKRLIGRDPFQVQSIAHGLLSGAFSMPSLECGHAASAIDMALHDLKGKVLGIPAYDLIGGRVRDGIRVYANGWCYRKERPEEYAEAARSVVEAGFTAMKFDPFRYAEGGFQWDIQSVSGAPRARWLRTAVARVEAVREAVGPEVDILLECHGKFDVPTAEVIADAMADFDLYWQEEPTGSTNVALLKQISDATSLPVAAGERLVGRDSFRPFIEQNGIAIAQPDLGMVGGITEGRAIAEHARQYGIFLAPHNAGGPICTAASVHLDLATPNFLIQETFPFRPPEYFQFIVESYESRIRDGYLQASTAPGLGVELDEERLRSATRIEVTGLA